MTISDPAMTDEQKAAYVNGQSACLIAEVLGMQAENAKRLHQGEPPAFGFDAFDAAISKYQCHHNAAIGLFHP